MGNSHTKEGDIVERELANELLSSWDVNNKVRMKDFLKNAAHLKLYRKDIAFWPNALIVYACSFEEGDRDLIVKQISVWGRRGFRIAEYDDILMAYILMNKTSLLSREQEDEIVGNINGVLSRYRDEIIPYRDTEPNCIYADLLGMVPQFLIMEGVRNKDEKCVEWGMKQFTCFIKNASDDKTGLLYHAYNKANNEKLGIIGWGRAMGWFMIGLSESILLLKESFPDQHKELLRIYNKYLKLICNYQRTDGGLSWQLQALDGPLDSSATAMVLQSICLIYDDLDRSIIGIVRKMFDCLEDCYDHGKVLYCSAECGGVGIYPQHYGSYSWSVAPYVVSRYLWKGRTEKDD